MNTFVSIIFVPEPDQWGLRGDPFLWRYLKERYQMIELPYSSKVFHEDVLQIFADLAGEPLASDKQYFVKQFAKTHVGMSTGYLSGNFWLKKAIPLLIKRLDQANQSKVYKI